GSREDRPAGPGTAAQAQGAGAARWADRTGRSPACRGTARLLRPLAGARRPGDLVSSMAESSTAAEVHGRLSDFLRDRREEIIAEWEVRVRSVRAARNLDRPLLLDHMPQYLDDLADYVAEVRSGTDAPPRE